MRKNFLFWLFLLIIVLLSYGQILGMGAWKDDNAIFFKFDHIYEQAGFFGRGLLGEGPYKFSITPYYPLYKIFGNQSFVPYYALILTFYFISTLCVYFLFANLFSKSLGKISAFIFATGFIASEGFFWLANAMLAHVSILLISLILLFYNLFFRKKKIIYYLLAVVLYWLSAFLVPLRTHFFILIILLFEFIFFAFKRFPKSFFASAVRLLPFSWIFYHYFASQPDSRTLLVKDFIFSILRGEFFKTFNFITSISNILIPTDYINFLFKHVPFVSFFAIVFLAIFYFLIFAKTKRKWLLTFASLFLSLVWFFVSKRIYSSPVLSLSREKFFIAFLGGIILYLLFLFYFLLEKKKRNLYLFLSLWVLLGIVSYSAYEPTAFFTTTHRYFTNSFFALVGILGLLFLSYPKLGAKVILVWALLNLVNNFSYQNNILKTRSYPVANFYRQLKAYLPQIEKGDFLYFDVAANAQSYFNNAFSVSSMPETTAIAWRYGIDRYDFYRADEFDDLIQTVKTEKIPLTKIYAFFYSKDGLINTTEETRTLFQVIESKTVFEKTLISVKDDLIVDLSQPLKPLVPLELELELSAYPTDPSNIHLPLNANSPLDASLSKLAFSYKNFKESFYQRVSVFTSSDWQKRVALNLVDQDPNTVWQADRLVWSKEKKADLILDLNSLEEINRFVWINGFANNTPTKYTISVSKDGSFWQEVKTISSLNRVESINLQVAEFSPQKARFVKMTILASLNDDSPGISEVWVVPSEFKQLDIGRTEKFLETPFSYVNDVASFRQAWRMVNFKGKIRIAWLGNKNNNWMSQTNSKINVVYDGVRRSYKITLPAGGTEISKIKLFNGEIPGKVVLSKINVRYPTLKELEK